MAISARLSRTLHRSLGDQGADDLVNWMIGVEANRSELNEVMLAWRATTEATFASIDARFEAVDIRFDSVDRRFDAVDRRLDGIDHRFERLEQTLDLRFDRIDRRFEAMDRRITDLFKWSLVFWIGSVGVMAGLVRLMK